MTDNIYRPRLLHLKGKKVVRVSEVPLSHKSLNSGDVFILDAGIEIIQFNGVKSGAMEKAKAAALVQAIEGTNFIIYKNNMFICAHLMCRREKWKGSRKSDRGE